MRYTSHVAGIVAVLALTACTAAKSPPATDHGDTTFTSEGSSADSFVVKRVLDKHAPDTLVAFDHSICIVPQAPHYTAVDTGATFGCEWRQ